MFHHAAGSLGIPHEAHRARATFREKRSTMFHHAAGSLGIPHEAHRARATFRAKRSTMFHHAACTLGIPTRLTGGTSPRPGTVSAQFHDRHHTHPEPSPPG